MDNVIHLYFHYRSKGLRPNHAWRVAVVMNHIGGF